jgi:hypothetical protein
MAFDRLGRFDLPPIEADDVLVWRNAGAYHIPWETRFSRGRCPVVWCDEDWKVHVARARETPQGWWSEWGAEATQ